MLSAATFRQTNLGSRPSLDELGREKRRVLFPLKLHQSSSLFQLFTPSHTHRETTFFRDLVSVLVVCVYGGARLLLLSPRARGEEGGKK
uniref:Transmembrane protein n=1 Tax=Caenorhabditis tropicalis TaxID=1561998 RepID=A0A1I7TA74_9PELO